MTTSGCSFCDDVGIEVVLPEIDRAAEVLRQKRHEPRHERVAEDHRARQRRVGDLGDEAAFFVGRCRAGRLDDARAARARRRPAPDPSRAARASTPSSRRDPCPSTVALDRLEIVARPGRRRRRHPRAHRVDDLLIGDQRAAVVPVRVGLLVDALAASSRSNSAGRTSTASRCPAARVNSWSARDMSPIARDGRRHLFGVDRRACRARSVKTYAMPRALQPVARADAPPRASWRAPAASAARRSRSPRPPCRRA